MNDDPRDVMRVGKAGERPRLPASVDLKRPARIRASRWPDRPCPSDDVRVRRRDGHGATAAPSTLSEMGSTCAVVVVFHKRPASRRNHNDGREAAIRDNVSVTHPPVRNRPMLRKVTR
jgi:hypothetical protein